MGSVHTLCQQSTCAFIPVRGKNQNIKYAPYPLRNKVGRGRSVESQAPTGPKAFRCTTT